MDKTYKNRVAKLMFKHMPTLTKERYKVFQGLCSDLDLTVDDAELDKQEWDDILNEQTI